MPEIIWKQGAENDLLQIFAELEDRGEEAGVRFVRKLDFTLENLPPNATIQIAISALNNGGESPLSDAITIVTH